MAINKVICNNDVLMDITSSTVSEDTLIYGITAFDSTGKKITGNHPTDWGNFAKWASDPTKNPLVIPEGVTAIPGDLFYLSKTVCSLTLPTTLKSIDYRAFRDCTALGGTVDLKNVTFLGEGAFRGCAAIKEVLMAGMESVGASSFSYCTGITSITFPGTVNNVKTGAFMNCTGLKTVTFLKGDMDYPTYGISSDAFIGCTALTDIYVYWASGTVKEAPWGAPSGCNIHYSDKTVQV